MSGTPATGSVTIQVPYNQLWVTPLNAPGNVLSVYCPFSWSNLTSTGSPTLSGQATLTELKSNGSVNVATRNVNISGSIGFNAAGGSGTITVPIQVGTLDGATAAIVLNVTISIPLQVPDGSTNSSFSPTFGIVLQNPGNQTTFFPAQLTSTNTVTAPAPASIAGFNNFPSSSTAQAFASAQLPVISAAPTGAIMVGSATSNPVNVSIPVVVSGGTPPVSPAVNNLSIGVVVKLVFGGLMVESGT